MGFCVEGLVSAGECQESRHSLNFWFYKYLPIKYGIGNAHKNYKELKLRRTLLKKLNYILNCIK